MLNHIKRFLYSYLKRSASPILLFHATYQSLPDNLKQKIHNVEPEIFYLIVKWLQNNYEICSVDDLFTSKNIKNKAAITFDDAYNSVLKEAIPILIELKIPSTIYLNCSSFDKKVFWRDKIRYIISNNLVHSFVQYLEILDNNNHGINKNNFYDFTKTHQINSKWINKRIDEFILKKHKVDGLQTEYYCVSEKRDLIDHSLVSYGNHTYQHFVLSSLTEREQRSEIVSNHEKLKTITKNVSKVFSIPFGGVDHINKSTINILLELGYKGMLFSYNNINFKVRKTYSNLKYADRIIVPNSLSGFKKNLLKSFIRPVRYNSKFKEFCHTISKINE